MEECSDCFMFLKEFCKNHQGPLSDDDPLPFRLVNFCMTQEEIEGESMDIVIQYLGRKCPSILAAKIARTVVDDLIDNNMSQYYTDAEQEEGSPQILTVLVARLIASKVNVFCDKLLNESDLLPKSKILHQVSVYAIKNSRRKMEDRHVILKDFNGLFSLQCDGDQSYYAVFDGHGGLDASVYAACHVHCNIARSPSFKSGDVCSAMREAYKKTDINFCAKSQRESLKSGSTGVSVIVKENKLYIAWLGDSQVLLVKEGKPCQLMDPHKPERQDEKERIEKLGGCVVFFGAWRVNGSLSVSRAIGDAEQKPFISGDADVASYDLDGSEDYLVLACDGMWDTVTYGDVAQLVWNFLEEGNSRPDVAECLVKHAVERGSNDNISVVVVFLNETIHEPNTNVDPVGKPPQSKD